MAEMTGFKNPVLALRFALVKMGVTIDEASFKRMAEERGDSSPEQLRNGFVVEGLEGIERLCQIANVVAFARGGIIFCEEPERPELNPANKDKWL